MSAGCRGWSWEDYNEDYQPERSAFPIYGNVAWFTVKNHRIQVMPRYFAHQRHLVRATRMKTRSFYVHRSAKENLFRYNLHVTNDSDPQQVPFVTRKGETAAKLLADTLHKPVRFEPRRRVSPGGWLTVHNVPVDSLFRHMMYRSCFPPRVPRRCMSPRNIPGSPAAPTATTDSGWRPASPAMATWR